MRLLNENPEKETETYSRKNWAVWIGLALIVLIAAAGLFIWKNLSEEPGREVTPAPAPPPAPAPAPEPEPPSPPTPTVGSLVVSANVEGARVFIGTREAGTAPYRASSLDPGTYRIRVEKEGYEAFEREVRIVAGERARVRAKLAKMTARLHIDSDVPGAMVFLDRNYLGTTPLEVGDIEAGRHELTASVEGYDMYAETLDVTAEPRDIVIRFKEVKLDETVPVVHKHRFGKCEGILHATVTHMSYETGHKDAFNVPHAAIERFEVDYMKKNLNIKVRGGRNYNFTAQSGNPDDLFVFYKKVTDARKKLKALH